jgi:biopolymer transport protein ExbB
MNMGLLALNWARILFVTPGWPGWILWVMSFVMLGVIIQGVLAVRRQNVLPSAVEEQLRGLLEARQYREAIESTTAGRDYLSFIMHAALLEAPHGFGAMERAMGEAAEERTARMLRYTEWLNLLGNIGPMIGLLGTVLGLIVMFFTIAANPDFKPGDLAESIGMKLVCTFLGLCVAVPALSAYGTLRNRIDSLTAESIAAARDMLGVIRRAKKAE